MRTPKQTSKGKKTVTNATKKTRIARPKRQQIDEQVQEIAKPVKPTFIFKPKNEKQLQAIEKIKKSDITFLTGPAGTGKTLIAIAVGCKLLEEEQIDKIILTRPVIEAGESLGFLPGGIDEKIAPYMMPLFSHLKKFLPEQLLKKAQNEKQIEIRPLAYMRGNTFENAYVICDECQDSSDEQLKMLLTRIGNNSKMVICSDPEQSDLRIPNRLVEISNKLTSIKGIAEVIFEETDIVRHRLISDIIKIFREIQHR